MSRFHRHLSIAVLISEFSHVFCCVLPTIVTLMSFAVHLGLLAVMPGFMVDLHEQIHGHETLIIAFSGLILVLGWGVHLGSNKVDCHHHGCDHPPCEPKKSTNVRILQLASVLFVVNVCIYLFVHQNILDLAVFAPVAH